MCTTEQERKQKIGDIGFLISHLIPCVTGRREFKKHAHLKLASEWSTVTDEAFAILLWKNSFARWMDMYINENTKESGVPTLFTKSGLGNGGHTRAFQGWSNQGIKEFNHLVKVVKENCKQLESIQLEEAILEQRKEIMNGKNQRRKKVEQEEESRAEAIHEIDWEEYMDEDEKDDEPQQQLVFEGMESVIKEVRDGTSSDPVDLADSKSDTSSTVSD